MLMGFDDANLYWIVESKNFVWECNDGRVDVVVNDAYRVRKGIWLTIIAEKFYRCRDKKVDNAKRKY